MTDGMVIAMRNEPCEIEFCDDCGQVLFEAPIIKHWNGKNNKFDTYECWHRWFQRSLDER